MTDAIVFTLHCTGHGAWFKQNQEGEVQQINASTAKFANIFKRFCFCDDVTSVSRYFSRKRPIGWFVRS